MVHGAFADPRIIGVYQVPVPMEIPVVQVVTKEVVKEVPVERIVWQDREIPVGACISTIHVCVCV